MRNVKFLLLFIVFYNLHCNKCGSNKKIIEDFLEEEILIKEEEKSITKEVPIWTIPDIFNKKDKKDKEEKDWNYIEIPDVKWWESSPFPEQNTPCNEEGKKRCLAPGNFKEGKKEYVVCEKDEKGHLIWKEYECNINEIMDCSKDKYDPSKKICKTEKLENTRAICQENQYGTFCCPLAKENLITDPFSGEKPCDKEGYKTCEAPYDVDILPPDEDGYIYNTFIFSCEEIHEEYTGAWSWFEGKCLRWRTEECGIYEMMGTCIEHEKMKGFALCGYL